MIRLLRGHRRVRDAMLAAASAAIAASVVIMAPTVHAAAGPCTVSYQVNQYTGGFTTNVGLTNTGAAVSSWTLSWTFGGNQQITSAWNAAVTQTGQSVKAVNLSYNGSVATGATVTFGFQATFSGTNAVPTDFALNGVSCSGGASASASASASAPRARPGPAPAPPRQSSATASRPRRAPCPPAVGASAPPTAPAPEQPR
jgi:hypothetical protein